jgi:hypothetical protein
MLLRLCHSFFNLKFQFTLRAMHRVLDVVHCKRSCANIHSNVDSMELCVFFGFQWDELIS